MEKLQILKSINNGKIEREESKGLTGYPSIDKPWEQYYIKEELAKVKPKRTVYQEIYDNNVAYSKDLALEYFMAKINYNKLFSSIDSTAKSLEEYGVKKGDFVTICAPGMPETVYSFYALSKIGAVANMMAPYFDKKGLVERIGDCESDILIVMDDFYSEIKDAIKKSRIKNVIVVPTLNSSPLRFTSKKYKLERNSNELFWNQFIKDGKARRDADTIGYEAQMPVAMVYSSGTTGAAKGILLSNDSFQNSIQVYPAMGIDITRGQKLYQIIPTWYSTGLSTCIHLPLSYGTAVFMDPRFDRKIFVKNIIKAKPNYTVAPTSMYEGFLDKKLVGNRSFEYLKYPFEGGEALRPKVAQQVNEVLDNDLMVAWGQCECGAAITTQIHGGNFTEGSVGYPLPGIVLNAFDENNNKLPYNERGIIYAATPCKMIGYYRNPKATDEYFYTDEESVKWNCTGDVGYINEKGEAFIFGRASDYTIINDKKIYNFDIEDIIMTLPEIKMCDVLYRKNSQGIDSLSAHIVFSEEYASLLEQDNELLYEEFKKIQDKIYEKTQDEDMVPTIFKVRKEFPSAKSGKRDILKIQAETDGFIEFPKYKSNSKKKKLSLYS